jgi:predicted RND superfamily exporter protein
MIHISKIARMADVAFTKLIPALTRLKKALTDTSDATLEERFGANSKGAFSQLDKNLTFLKTQVADRPIQIDDLPDALRRLYIGHLDGKFLLQVFGKEDLWENEPDTRFVDAVVKVAPHATGTPILNHYATGLLITSYLGAAAWAFVAIVLLILLHFQSFKYLLLTITPLILAVLWRSGVMVLAGISFNPANIVTLPLIIGIDVAFGIYIVDRFREDGEFRIFSESTGKAIIMSALTSFFGFVSLLVAEFRGVYSIGVLMSLGIAIGLVTSIFILPQILVLLPKKEVVKKT